MQQHPWDTLPQQFVERLEKIVPAEYLPDVLHSFCEKKPPTFRTNTLKTTTLQLEETLRNRNIPFRKVDWYEDAFILEDIPQKILTGTDLYTNGDFYVQSLSSMIPPLVLNPQPDERVCDLTAAPGSKTTQLAAMMENSGEIIANDTSRVRLYKLEANLRIQGVSNVVVKHMPGQALWKLYPEYFDKTLVDVPCSMEGRFQYDNPKTYKDWSTNKIKDLVQTQRFLLRSGISATKVGGTVVYSTCTLSPEENEGIINWIVAKEKGAVVIEEITLHIPEKVAGLISWGKTNFNPDIQKTLRVLPSATMEGFYIAKLKKIAPTVTLTHNKQRIWK